MYFHLGKDVVILKNSNGFSVIEAFVSLGILVLVATSFLPLASFVSYEKEALSHKRQIVLLLHDELQSVLMKNDFPTTRKVFLDSVVTTFEFTNTESRLIKGCATWTNIRNRNEEICIYGKQK